MTLESIGDFVKRSRSANNLSRIYRAHLLQGRIGELLGTAVTVTLRDSQVRLWCDHPTMVALAKLKRTKILAICHQVLGQAEVRLAIKLRNLNRGG